MMMVPLCSTREIMFLKDFPRPVWRGHGHAYVHGTRWTGGYRKTPVFEIP